MSVEDQVRLNSMMDQVWALAAFGRSLRAAPLTPALAEVLAAADWPLVGVGRERSLDLTVRDPGAVADQLRRTFLAAAEVLDGRELQDSPGDTEADGVASGRRVIHLLDALAKRFEGLAACLSKEDPGLLDVGTGVAGVSTAFVEAVPGAWAVGLDRDSDILHVAERRLRETGTIGRIHLRKCAVAGLRDRDRFDVAWVPLHALGTGDGPEALRRTVDALRPGGWLLVAAAGDAGSPGVHPELAVAVARWRLDRAGRCTLGVTQVRQQLEERAMSVVFHGTATAGDPPLVLAHKHPEDRSGDGAGTAS